MTPGKPARSRGTAKTGTFSTGGRVMSEVVPGRRDSGLGDGDMAEQKYEYLAVRFAWPSPRKPNEWMEKVAERQINEAAADGWRLVATYSESDGAPIAVLERPWRSRRPSLGPPSSSRAVSIPAPSQKAAWTPTRRSWLYRDGHGSMHACRHMSTACWTSSMTRKVHGTRWIELPVCQPWSWTRR